jgi:glycosyltransferase involved in cell wall biosynthesis
VWAVVETGLLFGFCKGVAVRVLIVTTVTRSAQAQLGVQSLEAAAIPVTVVVFDDRFGDASSSFGGVDSGGDGEAAWRAGSGVLGTAAVADLLAKYPVDEAVRASYPSLLRWALRELGSDVVLLAGLDVYPVGTSLAETLRHEGQRIGSGQVGLVPVRQAVPAADGRLPDLADLLHYGRFQRDMLVVTSEADDLLAWWDSNLTVPQFEELGRLDRVGGAWFDQLALQFPGRVVATDSALLGSFRNLDEIAQPAWISMEGFQPSTPWLLSTGAGRWPRVLLSAHLEAQKATSRFAEATSPWAESPYARLVNGREYDLSARMAYARAHHSAVSQGQPLPPNPFAEPVAFLDWLAEPASHAPLLTRHMQALLESRPDLAETFSNDHGAFLVWARRDAAKEGVWVATPPAMASTLAVASGSPATAAAERSGLNVVGLLSAQLGVGEHSRLALRAVIDSGVPCSAVDHDDTVHRREADQLAGLPLDGFVCDVDLLLVNADQVEAALHRYQRPGRAGRPTIGLWAWETPVFPDRFHAALRQLDGLWVLSDFVADALRSAAASARTELAVLPIQLPYVDLPSLDADTRRGVLGHLGVEPTRPYFTFMFDYFSVAERKQPWEVVRAFRQAFPAVGGGPQLVIKSMNHEYFPVDHERLLHACRGREDIVLVNTYLPVDQRNALVQEAVAYVSLHRAEGFGLTLAEAMGAGTPCIATGWSGNLDFMSDANSWLVRYELEDIDPGVPHYGGTGQWAKPDIAQAAELMRQVLDDPLAADSKAQRAVADLRARNRSGADPAEVIRMLRVVRRRHDA